MRYAIGSEPVRGRGHDRVRVCVGDSSTAIIVADGAGGMGGAARAAESTVRALAAAFEADAAVVWRDVLVAVDARLHEDGSAGETTAVALTVDAEGGIEGASVGDSWALALGLEGAMLLTEAQRRRPRLGSGDAHPVSFSAERASTVLVGSDGVPEYGCADALEALVEGRSPSVAIGRALEASRLRTGRLADDFTLVALVRG